MKRTFHVALLLLLPITGFCQTIVPSGTVEGIWDMAGSPYIVTGSISIADSQSLVILPGVEVRFNANTGITVTNEESITVVGTSDSSIIFTSNSDTPTPGDWSGISIYGTESKCSFKHVIIEYASSGIELRSWAVGCENGNNYTTLDSCIIRFNSKYGIYVRGSGSSSSGCTIPKTGISSPSIKHNFIYNNGDGIYLGAYSGYHTYAYVGASINYNIIYANTQNGIYCCGNNPTEPKIINNSILNNKLCGISFSNNFDSTDFLIINNIIANNCTGINSSLGKGAIIRFNDVIGNTTDYNQIEKPLHDISVNPLIIDSVHFNFNLDFLSDCIDAGCCEYFDPDGSVSDIGAIPFIHDPEADFEADITMGFAPMTISFSNKSIGYICHCLWSFGDGTTSTELNPSHIYETPGIYEVSLLIISQNSSDSITKTAYIKISEAPYADFKVNITSGTVPFTVEFTNLSKGSNSVYSWNFGDGITGAEKNPSHTYSIPGIYNVTLTSSGTDGTLQEVKTEYIVATSSYPNLLLNSEFNETDNYWNFNYISPATYNITFDTTYLLSGKKCIHYEITNGGNQDGSIIMGQSIPLVKEDYYQISFHAKLSGADTKEIQLYSQMENSPFSMCFSKDISLYDSIQTYGPFTVLSAATEEMVNLLFYLGNTNNICICFDAIYISHIADYPKAEFSVNKTNIATYNSVSFSNSSSGNITGYLWDFGDGHSSIDQNPSHIYEASGDYSVSLKVTGPKGDDTEIKTNYISVSSLAQVDNIAKDNKVTIFPNPASTKCTITLPEDISGNVTIKIFNLKGEEIISTQVISNQLSEMDLSEVSAGIYYITISSINKISTHKLIISR